MIDLRDIVDAARRLEGTIHRTPILSSRLLGERVGADVLLKCENLQKTGSFKPRGALNRVLTLDQSERDRGIITVSAGNHAQAVAWAAATVGAKSAVVMPTEAPASKIQAVRGYGGEAIFHDDRATLFEKLQEEKEARGATFVHPFDDPVVIAGAGTTGLEIMEDVPDVEVVVVPVGGGGLMAGVASAVKQKRPATRVVAVELEAGPGLGPALEAGKPVTVDRPAGTLADGMTPPFVGAWPLRVAREAVDRIVTVSEADIRAAIPFLLTRTKMVVEGSGAATSAALLAGKVGIERGERVVAIVSGGNIDAETLARVIEEEIKP